MSAPTESLSSPIRRHNRTLQQIARARLANQRRAVHDKLSEKRSLCVRVSHNASIFSFTILLVFNLFKHLDAVPEGDSTEEKDIHFTGRRITIVFVCAGVLLFVFSPVLRVFVVLLTVSTGTHIISKFVSPVSTFVCERLCARSNVVCCALTAQRPRRRRQQTIRCGRNFSPNRWRVSHSFSFGPY